MIFLKRIVLIDAASSVYKTAENLSKRSIGGDDFIDIWVYVVIQAQIRNLESTMKYIHKYSSPHSMNGEMGYYFSCLDVAKKFIEGNNTKKKKQNFN